MSRVIAVMARDKDEAAELLVHELPMASFASRHINKSGTFQIGDELANFARHMG
jgi:hypothetical protein